MQLDFPGILVEDFHAQTEGEQLSNILRTFWTKATVNIADGLDFQTGDNILVQMTLLQHSNFKWNITVNNYNHVNKLGTCRIFLAPKYDERGYSWKFADQKIMFIELDKFKVYCKYNHSISFNPRCVHSLSYRFCFNFIITGSQYTRITV